MTACEAVGFQALNLIIDQQKVVRLHEEPRPSDVGELAVLNGHLLPGQLDPSARHFLSK